MDMRDELIQFIQRGLKRRYNKTIVEVKDPFRDMQQLLSRAAVRGVIDGGGYHGEISIALAMLFPQATVYAFEPFPKSFDLLTKNVQSHSRISPVKKGLSSSKKIMPLYVNAQDSTNSLSPVGEGGKKYQSWQTANVGTEDVELVSLDEWLAECDVLPIDVVKLDLQGHELQALMGAEKILARTVKLVYSEVEFLRVYEQNCLMIEIESYLRSLGFELFQLYNLTSGEDNQLVCGDAIFINRTRLC
jgi:FkbM family methyltransferase